MKPEDVPQEWVEAAAIGFMKTPGAVFGDCLRAALAAVAPLIAQAERDACAEISFNEYLAASHDDEDPENHDLVARFRSQGGADSASRIRDAIRARGGEG